MAAPPRVSDNPVVQEHYVARIGLTETLAEVADTVAHGNREALARLVREFQGAAIALSVDYYSALREAAHAAGSYRPPVIDPWDASQISAYMDAVIADLPAEIDRQEQLVATGQRLTLDSGIDEVFAAMDRDPRKPRWARVARPDACSFCLMLASRGAAYRSEATADFRAHTKFGGRGGVCKCGVEVSFTSYEPPAHVRAAQQLYSESTADLPRGADRANAFRRALYAQRQTSR